MKSLLSLLSLLLFLACVARSAPIVHTAEGPVEGKINDQVLLFRGIPFAAPPVGTLRFKQPQPVTPWKTTLKCLSQKPICPQIRFSDFVYIGEEDCLYLDVYIPANATATSGLPVFFWMYGGGYVFGDGYEFGFYDGKNLVSKHNYIMVTPNYRLGALGFLALDGLRKEDPDRSSGAYGVQDQRMALRWVQRNIKAFGGDPTKVTILGESAGAFSVSFHLASEASKGLFRGAVSESGTADGPQFFRRWEDAVSFSEDYIRGLKCDPASSSVLTCIRGLSAGDIMGHLFHQPASGTGFRPVLNPVMPWGPAIDGSVAGLKDKPLSLIRAGKWNKVPVIAGTNENEGSLFVSPALLFVVPNASWPLREDTVNTTLLHFFGQNQTLVNLLRREYPDSAYKNLDTLAGHLLRDYFFACSSRRLISAVRSQGQDAYLYHFSYTGDFVEDPILGVYHSAELQFVFDNAWPPVVHIFTKRDREMSDTFTSFWGNFIKSGNPNGGNSSSEPVKLQWPVFDDLTLKNVRMDIPPLVESSLLSQQCDFWDRLAKEGNPWI